jgi:hypothetical protein
LYVVLVPYLSTIPTDRINTVITIAGAGTGVRARIERLTRVGELAKVRGLAEVKTGVRG